MPTVATREPRRRSTGRHQQWVRKNMVVDQRKLDAARRALRASTDTDAVDQALDLVAFRQELTRGLAAMRKAGPIDDVFEER
jgi:hypothetical protein